MAIIFRVEMVNKHRDGKPPRILVIAGVTASGKTQASLRLADYLPIEIVSADSVSVYRWLDIGSAKPTPEQRNLVPHHLIDVVEPDEPMSAALYERLAEDAVTDILSRGGYPVLVGGTGLYIRAVLHGLMPAPQADEELRRRLREKEDSFGRGALHRELCEVDPVTAKRLHPFDRVRIIRALEVYKLTGKPISWFHDKHQFSENRYDVMYFALDPGREILNERISARVREMLENGLLEEARSLQRRGYDPSLRSLRTPGYKQAFEVLAGEKTIDEAFESMCTDHRRYARRQRVWFRSVSSIRYCIGPDELNYRELADWFLKK